MRERIEHRNPSPIGVRAWVRNDYCTFSGRGADFGVAVNDAVNYFGSLDAWIADCLLRIFARCSHEKEE